MTGPPCGELSRYLDELRAQRKAEAVAAETAVAPDNCMAMQDAMPTVEEVLASIDWEAIATKAVWGAVNRRHERDIW